MTPALRPRCVVCGLNERAEGSNRCAAHGPGSIETNAPRGRSPSPEPPTLTPAAPGQAVPPATSPSRDTPTKGTK